VLKVKPVLLVIQEPWVAQVQKVPLETQEQSEIQVLKGKWVLLVIQEPWVAQVQKVLLETLVLKGK
jgi:hypothetical protein